MRLPGPLRRPARVARPRQVWQGFGQEGISRKGFRQGPRLLDGQYALKGRPRAETPSRQIVPLRRWLGRGMTDHLVKDCLDLGGPKPGFSRFAAA
eukprot:9098121-Alexandrium_andersonii.AAC.1